MARRLVLAALAATALAAFGAAPTQAERIKDLVQIEGARDNQLIGYGLVVGLAGTGDQTTQVPYSVQAIQNMLRQLGLTLSPQSFLQPTTVAAVMVTGNLKTFTPVGQHIDVTVSAMGNATSLLGGVLLMTELRGADGQVYAIAQGSILVSGFKASGQAASASENVPTVAHIPEGATVERAVKASLVANGAVMLNLDDQSVGNVARIADAINAKLGGAPATALSPSQIQVQGPAEANQRMRFLANLLNIEVGVDRPRAEVVIDAQSGTVVMGADVEIGPAAVAYGGLSVTINETPMVSQPGPFSRGETREVPRTQISVAQKQLKIIEMQPAPKISDIVRNLNAIGARSTDLIAILQALRNAGALHAHIKVI